MRRMLPKVGGDSSEQPPSARPPSDATPVINARRRVISGSPLVFFFSAPVISTTPRERADLPAEARAGGHEDMTGREQHERGESDEVNRTRRLRAAPNARDERVGGCDRGRHRAPRDDQGRQREERDAEVRAPL